MRIAIYGTGKRAGKMVSVMKKTGTYSDCIAFIETKPSKSEFLGKKVIALNDLDVDSFDKVIITPLGYEEEIKTALENLGFRNEIEFFEQVQKKRLLAWEQVKEIIPLRSVLVDGGLLFVGTSEDTYIMQGMFQTGETFSAEMIRDFFEISKKKYANFVPDGKYFLDIGANIGTTSIYVKSIINPSLSVIAFEPEDTNYRLLKANCVLNNVDIVTEHIGLSNKKAIEKFYYNTENPGGSGIVKNIQNEMENLKTINVIPLDELLCEKGISGGQIGYIWIDTEGYECEVIEGAMNVLTESGKIPLLQEFNPRMYIKKGMYDRYCENMSRIYDYFLDMHEDISNDFSLRPISLLKTFGNALMEKSEFSQTDLFFC